jgi:serine/threonine protein kinase
LCITVVVPLLAHFEAKLRLPGWSSARKNLVLVMPAGEVIDILSVREPRDMAQCGGELLAALAALHELRVLHNDVKWGNTLRVGASRRVVLCDFGLSVIVDVEGSAPMRRGVEMPGYMAPEVCVAWRRA